MSTVGGSTSKIDSHKRSEIGKVLIAVTVAVSFVDIAHAFETALYRRVSCRGTVRPGKLDP
jgi:hypothetical protein